jgi:hypothetical protein
MCRRKSISGNWKTNLGSSLLEQREVTDRWRMWVDAVSQMFGGLDICAIEAVVSKEGHEYIIEVLFSFFTINKALIKCFKNKHLMLYKLPIIRKRNYRHIII